MILAEPDSTHDTRTCAVLFACALRFGVVEDNEAGPRVMRFAFAMMLRTAGKHGAADEADKDAYVAYVEKMLRLILAPRLSR